MADGIIPRFYEEAVSLLDNKELTIITDQADLMIKNPLNIIKRKKNAVHIGATATLEAVKTCPHVPEILRKAIASLGSPKVRHTRTIGDSICYASPAGETLPPLYLLEAEVVCQKVDNERRMPIEAFIKGPGETVLEENESLREIIIKKQALTTFYYKKVGGRKADVSKISFTGAALVKNQKIKDIRVVFGGVAPCVIKKPEIEKQLIGLSRYEIKFKREWIKHLYESYIKPLDNQESSIEYKKDRSLKLLDDFILNL